jgi:hypothetical protein
MDSLPLHVAVSRIDANGSKLTQGATGLWQDIKTLANTSVTNFPPCWHGGKTVQCTQLNSALRNNMGTELMEQSMLLTMS